MASLHLVVLLAISTIGVHSADETAAIYLHSSLRQGSLCPGDRVATFTCISRGTELKWRVNGILQAGYDLYHTTHNNTLKTFRNITGRSHLYWKEDSDGAPCLVSTLTARPEEEVNHPVNISCSSNGSTPHIKYMEFLNKVADKLNESSNLQSFYEAQWLVLNWSAPEHNSRIQTIDYYIVQVGESHTIVVKNATASVFIRPQADSINVTTVVNITAVDKCGQKGEILTELVSLDSSQQEQVKDVESTIPPSFSDTTIPPSSSNTTIPPSSSDTTTIPPSSSDTTAIPLSINGAADFATSSHVIIILLMLCLLVNMT